MATIKKGTVLNEKVETFDDKYEITYQAIVKKIEVKEDIVDILTPLFAEANDIAESKLRGLEGLSEEELFREFSKAVLELASKYGVEINTENTKEIESVDISK